MTRITIINLNLQILEKLLLEYFRFLPVKNNLKYFSLSLYYVLIEITSVIVISIFYSSSFIDILSTLYLTKLHIFTISFLIMCVNILSVDLLTYLHKLNLYIHMCQVFEILMLILKEVFHCVYKAIIGSIKFRLKILIIMLSLTSAGLDQNHVNYMIISYIGISLVTTMYKSNNRSKQLCKLTMNLAIIITF